DTRKPSAKQRAFMPGMSANQTQTNCTRRSKELHHAAQRLEYDRAATLLESLSAKARDTLNNLPATNLPPTAALRDPVLRKDACETIASLCRIGGGIIEGRMRPS